MALSKKQIKQLRSLANHLNPLIIVGKQDLSDAALKQADETLEKHELVKCSVLDGSGLSAKEAAERLAESLHAEVVQVIGNRCVIYRRTHDEHVDAITLVRE
ncbi:YhbY family RNA-binding protein [Bifidobacterium psychraerophilum]|jgi:RNA-binding protein|uniref:RNA-binding protein, YhbY family n=1 Tax=Bifidobacterium psychraerophilum TaxID=218140 RepID=A0A087CDP4_9BIFI|nr:YhbY family RNA-binding protein [Bifidobacterium psychraerophilum]KFI81394.1 RNA-binding protein, YhbY family [Bifidobacterium psychraerophilum]MCI1659769.1 YhbY family RNA-binding protein [Bifidobacterium psychraerophilum]MCI1804610.1 YhbY family RNA-binding protein [Bifidobacterium psychraerophilum]MCI2177063.1 YhbY family RNA-binding protein [Bifidobacterium psychraerophilum]MCI2181603.1 YhbY family RNA-binding protein [Bifidobacterium psychraerophilum]